MKDRNNENLLKNKANRQKKNQKKRKIPLTLIKVKFTFTAFYNNYLKI